MGPWMRLGYIREVLFHVGECWKLNLKFAQLFTEKARSVIFGFRTAMTVISRKNMIIVRVRALFCYLFATEGGKISWQRQTFVAEKETMFVKRVAWGFLEADIEIKTENLLLLLAYYVLCQERRRLPFNFKKV